MKRILVIDDDIQIRQMFRQMLEREGYDLSVSLTDRRLCTQFGMTCSL